PETVQESWPLCARRTHTWPVESKESLDGRMQACSRGEDLSEDDLPKGPELCDMGSCKSMEELRTENANFKMLYDAQQQLIATLQAQLRVQEIDLDSMKQVNTWQEKALASLKDQVHTPSDDENRRLEDETKDSEQVETKSLEKLKSKLAKMSAESTLYREQADAQAMAALATSVRAGWKAACILPHESTLPSQTSVCPADRAEFSFVEWLFTRSLVRHRQARDPSLWCPTPRVKVRQVEKVENRTFLKRYAQRREELLEERAGHNCEALRDIKTFIGQSLQNRRSIEEVCRCSDTGVNLNEVLLFHGSPNGKINGILNGGFDPRYAGLGTGAMFGQGSYFAHNASKCFRYAGDSTTDPGGLRQSVLVVRALLGNPHYQQHMCPDRRMPPANTHSVVALTKAEGGCVDHREYVLYEKAAILPLYLIEFQHLPDCGCLMCCV
ncbi:unnamed protein product, partial [Durusdinium trenchii]